MNVRYGPDGVHIFERRTGTNLLLDEVTVPPDRWARAPRQVSIALTNACGLRCRYCYAPKHPARLATSDLKRWLLELDSEGTLGVGLGGGEPTLHPEFVALCRFASTHTHLAVSFTTHGHHLTERLAQELDGHVHFVRVSMDGVGSTYERLRGASYSALMNRLRTLRSFAPFGLNVVVNADTIGDLDEILDVCLASGAQELLLLPEQVVDGCGGIDPETQDALRGWVRSSAGEIRLTVSEAGADGLNTCDLFSREVGLRAYAHIDAAGFLKHSSYAQFGVRIDQRGVLHALGVISHLGREGS